MNPLEDGFLRSIRMVLLRLGSSLFPPGFGLGHASSDPLGDLPVDPVVSISVRDTMNDWVARRNTRSNTGCDPDCL